MLFYECFFRTHFTLIHVKRITLKSSTLYPNIPSDVMVNEVDWIPI